MFDHEYSTTEYMSPKCIHCGEDSHEDKLAAAVEKYGKPELQLIGEDGNGFFIVSRANRALERAGWDREAIQLFTDEATSGDYDHLLQTVMKYCEAY